MSSGLHLTKDTQELIKNIGESRSKQDEDNLIKKDIEKLKKTISTTPYEKMTNTRQVREIAIRAIYADMLGHDVSFTHFFLINMTNSKNLNVKRAGYLACWLLLGEDNDLKIMIVATLQRDLASESAYEVLIALNSLNKLMNPTNINNFVDSVTKHLTHANPLIRKKAFCLLQKMIKINPKIIPNWESKLREGLGDKEPSVMGACLNLYYQDLLEFPDKHKDILKILVTIMNLILDVKLPRDYDFQRIPAPWIQIRVLQIFGIICQNDKKSSDEVYNVVEKALRRSDDTMTDIGYAVTFQAIKTITKLYANQALLEKASKTIGKFFMPLPANSKINRINLFYLGIESMRSLVNINPKYATKHQVHIVDCLQHPDESIRRPTLDLLYKTTNSANLDVVMDKLLAYLKSTTEERFKHDLVQKIFELNERLAPNADWFVKKTNIIFQYGDECIDETMLSRTIKIIEENLETDSSGEFGNLLLQNYWEFLEKTVPPQLAKLICWIFSEVGCRLYKDDTSSLNQLAKSILILAKVKYESKATRSWTLTSLAKLSACEGLDYPEVAKFLKEAKESAVPEIRERAFEYSRCPSGIESLNRVEGYDVNLSFLRGAIIGAVEQGMPKYDPAKLTQCLTISRPESTGGELLTQHREVKIEREEGKIGQPLSGPNAISSETEELPKLTSKRNWFSKGGDSHVESGRHVAPLNFQPEKKPEPTEAEKKKEDKREKIAQNLFVGVEESNLIGGNKINKESGKKAIFHKPGLKPAAPPEGEVKKLSNPGNLLEMDQTDLLGGSGSGGHGKGTPGGEANILDLDFGGAPAKQGGQSAQGGGDLLGMDLLDGGVASNPGTGDQKKVSGPPKFVKPSFKPPQTNSKTLTPLAISESQYEAYWEEFNVERKEVFKSTNVRTQAEFSQMTKIVGFNITSTIDTDNICAAKFGDKIVLLYGKYKVSGEVEVMLNGNDKEAVDFAVDSIRKYCQVR
jgi:hypothetical protein